VVVPADCGQKSRLVFKTVPCPYCKTDCQLVLPEDQVASDLVRRGTGGGPEGPEFWAELNELERSRTVFETRKPEAGPGKQDGSGVIGEFEV